MSNDDILWLVKPDHGTDVQANPWLASLNLSVDPSFGYTIQDLLTIDPLPQLPAGGEEYWRSRYQRALNTAPQVEWEGDEVVGKRYIRRVVRFSSSDGRRLGAWLMIPSDREVKRLLVAGHGYGSVTPPLDLMFEKTACLHFCSRGFADLARFPDLPAEVAGHVVHGIEERDQYMHGWCAEDVWCTVNALLQLYPDPSLPLYYWGGSFGGGIGAMAVPWDLRIKAAYLEVPSFGNHPVRLQHPCTGSGEFVRQKYLKNPRVAETLSWFDAAATMAYARNPVLFGCAILDPAVPPFGQFSVWHAHPGKKKLIVLPGGHLEYPGMVECMTRRMEEVKQWFPFS
jgi:cephalosporin-C deacetylase